MRRAIATRRGSINDVGRSVMQRAEWYALNLGLKVMPGFANGKQKRTCGPWALVTSNLDEILAFGGGWNGGLIFTPAGESIITLDVDNKNGKQGSDDLAHLLAFHGPLPKTPEWRTPSGGRQILFRPGPHRIPKSVGTLGKRAGQEISGLAVIGFGAMTVLPGSLRPDGPVEWLAG